MTASVDPAAIRSARRKAGLTQAEVARALGLAGGEAVSIWERGTFEPSSPRLLHSLARVLHTSVPALLLRDRGQIDLRYLRLVAGLESADVADRLHVAVSTYRRWERGAWSRMPSEAVIVGLSAAFGVRPGIVTEALLHSRELASEL